MTKINLSICIPTYNFGKFIGQTLDSILPNLKNNVEVVILDGGSTDNTADVVKQRQILCPQIKYHQQGFKGGIDKDISKVVGLAQGDYCWLFSADDIMMPGAVDKILVATSSNCDVYLSEQIPCDYEMCPIMKWSIFNHITAPEIFNLGNKQQRQRYFSEARTSEAFFSFLAGPIFKRSLWKKSDGIPESFYETCWGLAGRLLSLISEGLTVHYLGEALLYKRGSNESGDNTSFHGRGMVNLFRISVEGYSHIVETIFGKNSMEAFNIQRVLRNEWTFKSLMFLKILTSDYPQKENFDLLKKLAAKHYKNSGVWNMFKYTLFLILPVWLLKFIRSIKRYFNRVLKSVLNKHG